MRLSRHKPSTTTGMNMTPMIDIVFLLIIFFMTVTQVSRINKERLELPKHQGSDDQQPSMITINVDQTGRVIVSGNTVSVSQLIAMVGGEIDRKQGDASRVNIVVRADQRGNSATVNQIVAALGKLQLTRIRIAVEVPEG